MSLQQPAWRAETRPRESGCPSPHRVRNLPSPTRPDETFDMNIQTLAPRINLSPRKLEATVANPDLRLIRGIHGILLMLTVSFFGLLPAAWGQDGPETSLIEPHTLGRGFDPTKIYAASDIDQINTLNGNLSLRIPIGPSFHIGGGFDYAFALTYNANAWDYESYPNPAASPPPPPGTGPICRLFLSGGEPMRDANAGHGWKFSFGQLYSPRPEWDAAGPNPTDGYLFVAGDGRRYRFDTHLTHPAVSYSTGSRETFLRLRLDPIAAGERLPERAWVDLPDGRTLQFSMVNANAYNQAGRWRLDRFYDARRNTNDQPANVVRFSWPEADVIQLPGGGIETINDGLIWQIEDGPQGFPQRVHRVTFAEQDSGGRAVRPVEVDLAGHDDARLVYNLAYENRSVRRGPKHDITLMPQSMNVPMLDRLELPADGQPNRPYFAFSYYTEGSSPPDQAPGPYGMLADVQLPTGGQVGYTYQLYTFPDETFGGCHQQIPSSGCVRRLNNATASIGVRTRTVGDAALDRPIGGQPMPSDTWYYYQNWELAQSPTCLAWRATRTTLFDPRGTASVSYYSAYVGGNGTTPYDDDHGGGTGEIWDINQFGLPFSQLDYREGLRPEDPPTYLSTEAWDCKGRFDPLTFQVASSLDTPESLGCPRVDATFARYAGFRDTPGYQRTDQLRISFEPNGVSPSGELTYHEDYLSDQFDDWNGLGQFRQHVRVANWDGISIKPGELHSPAVFGWPTRVERTEYLHGGSQDLSAGAPPQTDWPAVHEPWLLALHDQTSQQETLGYNVSSGSHSNGLGNVVRAVTDLCFDDQSGDLEGRRTRRGHTVATPSGDPRSLLSEPATSTSDLRVQFAHDSQGNVIQELYFGGAKNSSGNSGCNSENAPGVAEYERVFTHQHGSIKTVTVHGDGLTLQNIDHRSIDPASGLVTETRDPSGLVTTASYDARGRLTTLTPPGEIATTYSYRSWDGNNALAAVEVERGDEYRRIMVDGFGRVVEIRNRLPSEDQFQYSTWNALGQLLTQTEFGPAGHDQMTENRNYDARGRAQKVIRPDGSYTDFAYAGQRLVRSRNFVAGTLSSTTQTGWNRWQQWDVDGRTRVVREASDPDISGDSIADRVRTRMNYDVGGRLALVTTDTSGTLRQRRFFDYDGAGLLLRERHPELGGDVVYSGYDSLGNVGRRRIGDGALFDIELRYDPLGRPIEERDAVRDRPLREYTYADRNGESGEAAPFAWLRHGQLHQARRHNWLTADDGTSQDVVVTETYRYDDTATGRVAGRRTHTSLGQAIHTAAEWDNIGRLASISYPCSLMPAQPCAGASGLWAPRSVDYSYSSGRLVSAATRFGIGGANQSLIDTIAYHPNGMISRFDTGSGVSWHQGAHSDWMQRPSFFATTGATGGAGGHNGNLQSGPMGWDFSGNLMFIGNEPHRDTFAYDAVNRLIAADVHQPALDGIVQRTINYRYDRFGNLVEVADDSQSPRTITIDEATNRLTGVPFDVAGNQLVVGGLTVDYDALNMPWRMQGPGVNERHLYTADNERIATIDLLGPNGRRDRWTPRGLDHQVLQTWSWDQQDGWLSRKDYLRRDSGTPIATVSQAADGTTATRYLFPDHLGTPRLVTDESGSVKAYHKYTPYGLEVTRRDQDEETLQFTGHERDKHCEGCALPENDDLDYMHARYYSLRTARFMGFDPARDYDIQLPQSWNKYAYVRGNPLRFIDPNGLECAEGSADPDVEPKKDCTPDQSDDSNETDDSEYSLGGNTLSLAIPDFKLFGGSAKIGGGATTKGTRTLENQEHQSEHITNTSVDLAFIIGFSYEGTRTVRTKNGLIDLTYGSFGAKWEVTKFRVNIGPVEFNPTGILSPTARLDTTIDISLGRVGKTPIVGLKDPLPISDSTVHKLISSYGRYSGLLH